MRNLFFFFFVKHFFRAESSKQPLRGRRGTKFFQNFLSRSNKHVCKIWAKSEGRDARYETIPRFQFYRNRIDSINFVSYRMSYHIDIVSNSYRISCRYRLDCREIHIGHKKNPHVSYRGIVSAWTTRIVSGYRIGIDTMSSRYRYFSRLSCITIWRGRVPNSAHLTWNDSLLDFNFVYFNDQHGIPYEKNNQTSSNYEKRIKRIKKHCFSIVIKFIKEEHQSDSKDRTVVIGLEQDRWESSSACLYDATPIVTVCVEMRGCSVCRMSKKAPIRSES